MKIEQIYTACLAHGAYYVESDGKVAIIDPLRETAPYITKAEQEGVKIKYIFESHFHADFVSGHIDLAKATGAKIIYGPIASTEYDIYQAADGEIFELGKVKIKVLHTPGHTMESSTFLLIDENGKEYAIFTGDTLFIGDVGRPDLAIKSEVTQEDLAGFLFESLRNKIMPLADDVIVYPAHGAGSACGKNISKETWDTLGNQKKINYALRADMTKAEFIDAVTTGILPAPQYFAKNVMMNKTGYDNINNVLKKGNVPLDIVRFEAMASHEGALILDTRHQNDFVRGFIPNSVFIGIDGRFAPWIGTLITDIKQPIIIVADKGKTEEVVLRLSRVGYDNSLGYLEGGFETWKTANKSVDTIESIPATKMLDRIKTEEKITILDVRKSSEYAVNHVNGSSTFPLDYINEGMSKVNKDENYMLYCLSGYRSVIAASILKARGFQNLVNIQGGFKAISKTEIEVTDFVSPSTV